VLYATSFIPGRWYVLYHLNPMTSLVEGVRWSILPESPAPDPLFLGINIATILVGVVASVVIFKKLESIVIDRI
jgi:ABC-type polysaccharide/polyol phosphate export permease